MRPAFAALGLLLSCSLAVQARTDIQVLDLAPDLAVREQVGQSFRLQLSFDEVETEEIAVNGQIYTLFHLEGEEGMLGRTGQPDLPLVNRMLELPDRAGLSVELLGGDYEILENVLALPMQDALHHAEDQPQPWHQDEALYSADAWVPANPLMLDDPALLRNRRLVKTAIAPIQVNPGTQQARVWRTMELEVRFEGVNPVNQRDLQLPEIHRRLPTGIEERILNAPSHSDHALDGAWIDPGDLPGKYLVFVDAAALGNTATGLAALIEWKRQRGHTVVIESSPSILNSDTAIKSRITSEYNSEDPVKFVLLCGDVDGSYAIASNGSSGYDHFFSTIEGGDILADVAVGRLSADNLTQMATITNKILQYERNPWITTTDWLRSAYLLVGSSHCHLSMKQLSRNIGHELVETRGYDDIDTTWCQGGNVVVPAFNSGISFYNYRGWVGMEGLSSSAVLAMAQGPRTPVATIFTCGTGDFTFGDDMTEHFLRAGNPTTPGGAVACMGYATLGTHTRYNNVMCGGFYHAFLEHDVPEVGSCLAHSKFELFQTLPPGDSHITSFSNWGNLMGDPGMRMWAGVPQDIDVDLPASLRSGTGFLELGVSSNGEAAAGVIVSAFQDQGDGTYLQRVVLTDDQGMAWLDLEGLQEGALDFTLSSHRHVPVAASVPVTSATMNPVVGSLSVDGNPTALPGVSGQALSISVMNDGNGALSNLSITADLDPMYGTLAGGPLNLASLAQGETSAPLDGMSLSPVSELADGDRLPLVLTVAADEGTVEMLASVTVSAPTLVLNNQSYPDGQWLPATTRSLRLTVQNGGSEEGGSVQVTLVSDEEDFVTVSSGTQDAGSIAPGGSAVVDFDVEVTQDALVGMSLQLHAEVAMNGGDVTQRIDLLVPVGTPGQNDPTGPDAWGYWAYEDEDDTYAQAPTFEWIGIAPAEGGEGTLVPLSDNGDEQDDAAMVDLPFDFRYYGEYYDEIMVCSNGFISFGDPGVFWETDFRNHYLPSGMGPDAMIAPMWDDHLTQPGDVYTWHDEANHTFIIEWYDLNANASGGPNTFQLILYDPAAYPTGTGDGEFKFQYEEFNDNQSASTDFPNCSIGMKDHSSTMGMTLKNYGILNPTMHTISDGTAILFTTTVNGVLAPAEINVDPAGLGVELASGEATTDSLEIGNLGEVTLLYNAWLSFDARDSGGPDSYGYEWTDSNEDLGPDYSWVDGGGNAVPVSFAHNDSTSGWFDVGFDFYLYGEPYDQFRVSPNGFISFGSYSGAWSNQELPSPIAPANSICVWWDDLRPEDNVEGYCWYESNGVDSLVVSWTGVPHYNPGTHGGPFTAQAILQANGQVTLQYEGLGGGFSGTAGFQGADEETGITVFHNQAIETPYAVRITPPAWAVLTAESGIVAGNGSSWLPIQFNSAAGYELPMGEYNATLHLSSNDPENAELQVPITMTVQTTDVIENAALPETTALKGNYPNPFNPSTVIRFDLARSGPVRLSVYNMVGQQVATLVDGPLDAGSHSLNWDASPLASGIYLLEMTHSGGRDTSKLMLMK